MLYTGTERRIKKGVKKVVIIETDTMMGYINGSITLKLKPNVAMINENSPIC